MSESQDPREPGLARAIGSAIAAAFGVQSGRNRERDFKHGKARNFIIAGVLFTLVFILTIVVVVKLVLRQAGM
ncbi:MAG TPA: DUF2970 domain-containing protein [Nevskia sp.]|jgi:hypothetical protein|nr:DUF2970 domain-containing protein [Nevskia sp.]